MPTRLLVALTLIAAAFACDAAVRCRDGCHDAHKTSQVAGADARLLKGIVFQGEAISPAASAAVAAVAKSWKQGGKKLLTLEVVPDETIDASAARTQARHRAVVLTRALIAAGVDRRALFVGIASTPIVIDTAMFERL